MAIPYIIPSIGAVRVDLSDSDLLKASEEKIKDEVLLQYNNKQLLGWTEYDKDCKEIKTHPTSSQGNRIFIVGVICFVLWLLSRLVKRKKEKFLDSKLDRMLSRGIIFGKIVDDLGLLQFQVKERNKLGQFDLTKVCEEFFREVLSLTYKFSLKNLNQNRSNEPGLDLGSIKDRIAYQATSQKKSDKVNSILAAITEEQAAAYSTINVFIIGEKQSSYTLNPELS
ncbi:MAG: SMEK domain-containing protein [Flavipsychrobacter sp.]|nr:SMEK domain-containing protein [Flavipsychrobacter sp.]